jgi:hypothetical protein
LLGFAVGTGVGEVPESRDWFGLGSMDRWSAKNLIFTIFVAIGLGLGILVDVVWRAVAG